MKSLTLIEELSLNALPAVRTLHLDGWILRFARGYSKRANSVNPLYPPAGALDLGKKISICERLYRAEGLPPIFKLTSRSYPATLDQVLEEEGYRSLGLTSVQTLSLTGLAAGATDGIWSGPDPSEAWLEAVARIGAFEAERKALLGRLLQQIVPPACFALLEAEGTAVAAGYAVAKAGFVGLFQIATDPRFRRQGYGYGLTGHLLRWGKREGAHTAYLQVECENEPALHLYRELGFHEHYHYWYRVGPPAAAA